MAFSRFTLALAASLAFAHSLPADDLGEALAADDQCAAGDEQCALSAVQLRGLLKAAAASEHQFNKTEEEVSDQPLGVSGSCYGGPTTSYALNWAAAGGTFFDDWTFMKEDEMHGASEFVQKDQALKEGIISTTPGHVKIGVGAAGAEFKRKTVNIHTNKAWDPQSGFLAVIKYAHVPWGAGVWPGFWAMNSDVLWPNGGELDIMEYANDEPSKVTFHTNKNCFLDSARMQKCAGSMGMDTAAILNCNTNYFQNLFGCKPSQKRFTGQQFAGVPAALAMEWTPQHIKVFLIPQGEIPKDLASDAPRPENWDKWVMAYFPFDGKSCQNIAQPQELVISMGLCGDWAGGAWAASPSALSTGVVPGKGCKVDIWDPAHDCCTKFVTSTAGEQYLKQRAYFDIDYVKVYTPGGKGTAKPSGTFQRGGVPLK